ncbi:MAG TPA: biotin transporter BioY [Ktedonobacteraceae bacterium]|nr:biotin transporter BioY [Ktedonobacteraceae bacterium]
MAISHHSTLVDHLLPASNSRSTSLWRDGALVIGFSLFMGLCAQFSFHIPALTPVPITLQTLGVLLTGAALGSKRGALALLAYLAEGALGLPFFAGGTGGFIQLIGFTGGYLWSYPIAAFVTGWLCERGLDRSVLTSALAMLPGSLIIYALGVTWLAFWLPGGPLISMKLAFIEGMLPFLIGDTLKLIVAALLLPTAWGILRLGKHAR